MIDPIDARPDETTAPQPRLRARRWITLLAVLALTAVVFLLFRPFSGVDTPPARVIRMSGRQSPGFLTADGRSLIVLGQGVTQVRLDRLDSEPQGRVLAGSTDLRPARPSPPGTSRPSTSPTPIDPVLESPDGRWIVASNQTFGIQNPSGPLVLRVWDANSGSLAVTLPVAGDDEPSKYNSFLVEFGHGGRLLQAARWIDGRELVVLRWDVGTWRALPRVVIPTDGTFPNGWTDDGRAFVFFDKQRARWTVHDIEANRVRWAFSLTGPPARGSYHSATFTPDGRTAAIAMPGNLVKIWDVPNGRIRGVIRPHDPAKSDSTGIQLAMAPDGQSMAVVAGDNSLAVWDLARDQIRFRLPGSPSEVPTRVTFAPDGRALAIADAPRPPSTPWTRFRSNVARELRWRIQGPVVGPPPPRYVSPGRIRLIEADTGRSIREFATPPGDHSGPFFPRDGRTLGRTLHISDPTGGAAAPDPPDRVETWLWEIP